jgi:hypothetical protein
MWDQTELLGPEVAEADVARLDVSQQRREPLQVRRVRVRHESRSFDGLITP